MLSLLIPDVYQVKRWLDQAGIRHYVCDNCHGLHMSELQACDGVADARLFVEDDRMVLTTDLELRPSAVVMALAETSLMNIQYPHIKVFVDINDDSLPRLVACCLLLSRQGVTFEQFIYFIQAVISDTVALVDQCRGSDWLSWPDGDSPEPTAPHALH